MNLYSEYKLFDEKYKIGGWQNKGSGNGSVDKNTIEYRKILHFFIEKYNIKTCLDIGCGDFQIMRHIYKLFSFYRGIDVSSICIENNKIKYEDDTHMFEHRNILDELFQIPDYELVIVKDVFQHMPNEDIILALDRISKFQYAIIVNDRGLNKKRRISVGGYAGLDILAPPFLFPGKIYTTILKSKVICMKGLM